jgi:hypothetical protein
MGDRDVPYSPYLNSARSRLPSLNVTFLHVTLLEHADIHPCTHAISPSHESASIAQSRDRRRCPNGFCTACMMISGGDTDSLTDIKKEDCDISIHTPQHPKRAIRGCRPTTRPISHSYLSSDLQSRKSEIRWEIHSQGPFARVKHWPSLRPSLTHAPPTYDFISLSPRSTHGHPLTTSSSYSYERGGVSMGPRRRDRR